ncbi:hypothetical protein ACWIYZ_03055 [Ursidibacter arcticus]
MNQLELLKYIWKNRQKWYFFKVKVMKVSPNNTSREFCIYIVKGNRMINLNSLIARLSTEKHVSLKKDNLFVRGCGMDMAFFVLEHFLDDIAQNLKTSKAIRKIEHGYCCDSAQQYELL